MGATRKLVGYFLVVVSIFTIGYLGGFVAQRFEEQPAPLLPPPPVVTHSQHSTPPGLPDGAPR